GYDDLTFLSLTTAGGSVTLNSNNSNIELGGINGTENLVLDAGIAGGTTTVTGNVVGLGTGTGAALTVQAGVTGLVRFQGPVAASSGFSAAAGTSLRFDQDVTLADGTAATNLAGNVQFDGLIFSGFDGLILNAVTLSGGPVTLDSNGSAIQIATLTGAQNLILGAGIGVGTTTFTGTVTNLGTGNGAALTIENGVTGLVYFQNTVGGNSGLVADAATSNVRFDQDVALASGDTGTNLPGAVQLDGLTFSCFDGLTMGTVTLSTAQVTLNSNGGNVLLGPVDGGQTFVVNSGAGTTTFSAPVGAGTPLSGLWTDAGGTTQINGGSVATTLYQTYGDPVTLDAAGNTTTLTNLGAVLPGIAFGSTLGSANDGVEALVINDLGVTAFGGVVGAPGQSLASLTTGAGMPGTLLGGVGVTTVGTQTYNSPVFLGVSNALTGGSVLFNSSLDGWSAGLDLAVTITSVPAELTRFSNVGTTTTLRNLTVNTVGNIELNSTIWTTGNIALGSALTTTPEVATIYKATAGNVDIATNGGNFDAGALHKITVVNGSLIINTGAGTMTLNDAVAWNNITLTGATINFVQRAPSNILTSDGLLEGDWGVDFVAATGVLDLNATTVQLLNAAASDRVLFGSFASPDGPTLAHITSLPGGDWWVHTPARPLTLTTGTGTYPAGTLLDERPNGWAPRNVAEALATAIPGEPPARPVTQQVVLSPALRELLEQLGIFARDLTAIEQNLLAVGMPVAYDDMVKTDEPQHSDYTVAAARLPDDLVQETVGTYRRVFEKEGKYQDTEARSLLQKAFDAYKATTTEVDPLAFRRFVENTPEQAAALQLMNELRRLFAQTANLGLTSIQIRNAEQLVVRGITPTGLTPEQLVRAIKGGAAEGVKKAMQTQVRRLPDTRRQVPAVAAAR
ncbi:MAG TPA: hypothetical protein VNE39_04195, partial [Planctomycetota bacterium]|nr:hypothetical protein [Planctomycetota bacterium]